LGNDLEQIGDELGINTQSTSNHSDDENSHVEISSDKEVSPKPNEDRFRNWKFQSTSISKGHFPQYL
jgi:hypothetical protein